ncbi:MAG: amino acid ABC transporter permease [Oscillospiraceae bacterium]|jgi:His/Glu/Gln/Arg/opine family amino acid ABC transporter permease subunit|nr:amino acid ABC transporter permease [Oscillospiraceae bacterium]
MKKDEKKSLTIKMAISLVLMLIIDCSLNNCQSLGLKLEFERIFPFYKIFINGIINTFKITGLSFIFGSIFGILIAIIKVSKFKILKLLARFYTSVFRGTPLLVQVFLIYFATPQIFNCDISSYNAAVIAFSFNSAAYISEILRGGIESIDRGQTEAAIALGVSRENAMLDIVFPQAIKNVLPALVNETIALLKESSLVSTIGMIDMMRAAQIAMNSTYLAFEPFLIVAILYYVLVMFFTFIASLLERRLKKSDRN